MKKIFIYLFSALLIVGVSVSCSKDEPKGNIESVAYDAAIKSFVITYSSGYTEKISAKIDDSTNPPSAYIEMDDGTIIYVDDAINGGEVDINSSAKIRENKYVNNWIYDEMSIYYYWNTKLPRDPNVSLKPDKFFDSILYKYSSSQPDGDRFSWIQDDYKELQGSLSGVASDEIGFDYIFAWADKEKTHYYALVTYTMHDTDAKAKGIERGQFITEINGQKITPNNYRNLFGGTGTKTISRAGWIFNEEKEGYYLSEISPVNISMHKNFAENPVYMDSVYSIGNKKIGYLVYNFFATDKGDLTNSYDKDLMNRLQSIKDKGATEMVLDLRYNSGGAVSSAIALSSALVKNRSTSNVLVTSEYNSMVQEALLREYGNNFNKEFFIDKIVRSNKHVADIPTMNQDRLFILTGDYTASASEFVINGLRPYMDVILIGSKTYGKNVGSITIFEKENPKNKWGMQPIIVKYFNSLHQSDFTDGFTPDYNIDEFKDLYLEPFGKISDPLLGKAISLITGSTISTTKSIVDSPLRSSQIDKTTTSSARTPLKFELVDDINDEAIRKIRK